MVTEGRPMIVGVGFRGRTLVVDSWEGSAWIVRWAKVVSSRRYIILGAMTVDVGELTV